MCLLLNITIRIEWRAGDNATQYTSSEQFPSRFGHFLDKFSKEFPVWARGLSWMYFFIVVDKFGGDKRPIFSSAIVPQEGRPLGI